MRDRNIVLKKVCVHNLKSVTLTLRNNDLIVMTGVSGSGKSSLAFDTLYVEGQRRYVESLSTFARRQMGELSKPDLESATGISPTIAIEQKTAGRNPRSTVGTLTEIYDHLRVLYARVGIPHCPVSGEAVTPQSRERIIKVVQNFPEGTKLIILAPYAKERKAEFKEDFLELLRKGFTRARIDGKILNLNDDITLDGNVGHDVDVVIDRTVVESGNQSRLAESITTALGVGNGVCSVLNVDTDEEQLFSMHAYSVKSGLSYISLEPHDFSFNSPSGMCPRCNGLAICTEFDLDLILDPNLSIAQDCCSVASSYSTVRYGNIYDNLARIYNFSVDTPWKKLSEPAKKVFLYGTTKKWTRMHFTHPITGATWIDNVMWRGVLHDAHTRFTEAKSDSYRSKMQKLMHEQICPECHGSRLKPYPAATQLEGKRIHELTAMTVAECQHFFETLHLDESEMLIATDLLKEIRQRLQFLLEVGLHYLALDRTAPTLSGGEAQRVRLASQIGGGLVGITYILDEPSIGLHPRDNTKLIRTLKHLRDMGNTVVVVEHDEETIWEADQVVDFGPGPGSRGGEVVVSGDLSDLLASKQSVTGAYLRGDRVIEIPKKRRKPSPECIEIKGATHHNLKNVSVKFPLGVFTAVTGVSGSGKSSLITDILHPALSNHLHGGDHIVGAHKQILGMDNLNKVIAIDQTPIGRNPRSNPATYIKLFDEIRDLFCQLPESKARGYKPGRFSFNVKEGSCPQCEGMGLIKIDMDFMEAAWIDCPLCKTKRFDHDTLSVFYKGKNIYDVLEMEVGQALEFFANIPSIKHKLETLKKVGLEYIKLGQSSTTLSGGEAQRIKLAKELVRPATGKTLYILDEPTTGLHFHDIKHLLEVLQAFVDRGNSVLVIEHNMDVVKTADWIIDLGPEGGYGGGEIVATGKPEQIAKMETPTGEAVRGALFHDHKARVKQALAICETNRLLRKERDANAIHDITVVNAEQNNLKNLDVTIPREKLIVFTGPSGSGKTSLAFDTIYAEGQRRYIESLSPYARQFVKQMPKPRVGYVGGLSPAIAIEQKAHAGNPRSTVGTMTETYDYLRVLYARVGIPHSPETGEEIKAISKDHVVDRLLAYPEGERMQILAPIEMRKNDKFEEIVARLRRQGFLRIRLNGTYFDLDQEAAIEFDRKRKNELFLVIDRLKMTPSARHRVFEAVETAAEIGGNKLVVAFDKEDVFFNLAFAVESTGKSYPEITPHTFAFNTAEGMCPECQGLGYQYGANLVQNTEIMELSIIGLMRLLWQDKTTHGALSVMEEFLRAENIDLFVPMSMLPQKQLNLLMNGSGPDQWYRSLHGFNFRWVGINHVLAKAGKSAQGHIKELIIPLLNELECPSCNGARVNPLARNVTISGLGIHDVCRMPIDQGLAFLESIPLTTQDKKLLEEVRTQLLNRLRFLCNVGLQYLALDRRAPTLSGGESQRIRLARQLGNGLTGVLYVLDEPTIGLHPRDNDRLNQALKQLKDLGNTLLLVEHDPLTIETADYILDFGPQAGTHGGHITAQGTLTQIKRDPNSLTGAYLSGRQTIPLPEKRRPLDKGMIEIKNAHLHNLKNIDVSIPVSAITCLTGVSGSGKSTLMNQVLAPAAAQGLLRLDEVEIDDTVVSGIDHFDRIISIDQNPIGHTVRSDVCTYVDVLTRLRELFSSLPVARMRGLQPKHFSYNHRKGMCTTCWGLGYRRIYMHFLPPVKIVCEECKGLRLNPVSLEVTYAGKNLGQYLDSTVDEVRRVFENHPRIVRILDTLISVGLGYLKLGQEMASLSGGEAQRIKLSRELAKRSSGKTLYLLDEPTTGLHSDDIKKLLGVLHRLVDKGNTMIIIEHNMDVIANADYIVDLGPEAGEKGGNLVCAGIPEEILDDQASWTAKYLREQKFAALKPIKKVKSKKSKIK
ncbi:MAG: excinuclease ABC subunit UvrA [Parachlamydiaceae bacterium]|nr:excinuclease ABC subunit UvrA [Parachlamydiaceae bacterium]